MVGDGKLRVLTGSRLRFQRGPEAESVMSVGIDGDVADIKMSV